MAYANGKNPFMDDPDDDLFGGRRRDVNSSKYDNEYGRNGTSDDPPPYDDGQFSQREVVQQQMQHSMNRQLEGTQRCLASIYESEQIGIATAEELVQQGEQLDNIEQKVDKINADTKVSQRHLNSVKSIFGGIRNWWNGEGKKDDTPSVSGPMSRDRQQLKQTIASAADRSTQLGTHPAMRLRSDDIKGFYDEDVVEFGSAASSAQSEPRRTAATSQVQSSSRSAEWQTYEKNLSANLDLMSSGMAQLKNLAIGLGDEIETQNDQLDRIAPKVDRADTKIRDQNRQMRQILGK
jgi:synaptosomal-associated protein 29